MGGAAGGTSFLLRLRDLRRPLPLQRLQLLQPRGTAGTRGRRPRQLPVNPEGKERAKGDLGTGNERKKSIIIWYLFIQIFIDLFLYVCLLSENKIFKHLPH